ncbi:TetR family transcriptional regulator [Corynebacterium sp. zg254]|uniref:TetR/AcrR family transcriptional regulator n=1 Tax=Corynebacterium zhongnanshanii TaxID=2768834 RepID=A0ABQ6VD46_9CORY|nr:TetR/AcrR family transcriptional regulator [Corynebacterium zhongnanshanii]MCR5914755.1 TetR family transcriptional regulator [Corynebacterium sp. zg254]
MVRADAVENREAILNAAWRLFSTHGIDVSRRAIAKEAGVGVATLQRHFPTQQDLAMGVIEHGKTLVADLYTAHPDAWDARDTATQAWEDIITRIIDLGIGAFATQLIPTLLVDGKRTREADQLLAELLGAATTFMDRGRRWGLIRDDLTPLDFHLILAATSRPLPQPINAEAPQFMSQMTRIVIDGLKAPDAGARTR